MTRVLLLGDSGLIGRDFQLYNSVYSHFVFEFLNCRWDSNEFKTAVLDKRPDVIINAISSPDFADEIKMQSIHFALPKWLSENSAARLILFSTDVVDQLTKGVVAEKFRYYAQAKYAMEEVLKDKAQVTIIRTSIIGISATKSNLIAKLFINNERSELTAYENAYWSGITTLELYKLVAGSIRQPPPGGLIKAASEKIAISDLITYINDIFGYGKRIIVQKLPEEDDRSFESSVVLPDIRAQLDEMSTFCRKQ